MWTLGAVSSSTVAYTNAVSVASAISVSMLVVRARARTQAPRRNGQPHQNWIGTVSAATVQRAATSCGVGVGQRDDGGGQRDRDEHPPQPTGTILGLVRLDLGDGVGRPSGCRSTGVAP